MKKGKMEAFRAFFFTNKEDFLMETTVRIYQRTKAQGGFKDDVFSEEMHSLKAQKTF